MPINVADEMAKSFLDYSMSVIVSRALPDVRDGLKPSQRRILLAMHDLGLAPGRNYRKCAKICGDTSGNYHPHGEATIYPTLVNMAQPWSMRDTLIDGQGNFGSVEGDPPAAMRYTEARLTHLGHVLMSDMDKDTVDFVANYDDTQREPVVFPGAFPNLLVNGGTGIAVGMTTNIPPHNLSEVINGIFAMIDNPDITHTEMREYVLGPDFPTGCTILGLAGTRKYMETGRGSIRVRGTASIQEGKTRDQIIITEIPYYVNRATLVERIAELVNTKVITEISAVRDESDENTRVVVDLKRDARSQVVLNNLYKHTQLETSYSANMLAIDNRRPRMLSIKDAIACYIEHRREVVMRRTRYLLAKAEVEAERLEAFLTATGNLDEVIEIVRSSKNRDEAFARLKKKTYTLPEAESYGIFLRGQASIEGDTYVLTDKQVDHILDLRLYQLTGLEQDKIRAKYGAVLEDIKDLLDILAREERVLQIIKDELLIIQEKYGTPRKTGFAAEEGSVEDIDLIANDASVITISHRGYIKRTAITEFRTQGRGGKGLKGMVTREAEDADDEADFVEQLYAVTAHDYLLFFTDTGRVYVERAFQIPEMSRTSKGRSIKNFLNLRPEEKIASTLRVEAVREDDGNDITWDQEKFVLFVTKDGTVKKTALGDFRNFRKDGIIAIRIDEGNSLLGVKLTNGENDLCLVTRNGYCVRCNESTIRSMGRPSRGVAGIRPREGDYVVGIAIVDENSKFLVASEKGLGKRTPFEDYPTKGRGGKGVITMKTTEKTGLVAAALAVADDEDIMLMTSSGQSVRIPAESVSIVGRATQGVRLMSLKEGETIQDITRVAKEEVVEEEAAVETAEAETPAPPTEE